MSKPGRNIIPGDGNILYLDIGHSAIKAACRRGMEWVNPERFSPEHAEKLLQWIQGHEQEFDLIVAVSVVPGAVEKIREHLPSIPIRKMKNEDIPGELMNYDTPESLGLDRFFACYGAVAHTSRAVVVIDAGTACTVDYMSENYVYYGGVILPGIGIVEKSVKKYVPNLPGVPRTVPEIWPGKSTRESLRWGMAGMYRETLNGFIGRYRDASHPFEIVLTGGDVEWIQPLIEGEAKVRPMLVFEGIKRFLEDYL